MKKLIALSLCTCALYNCSSFKKPLNGDFDPLRSPLSGIKRGVAKTKDIFSNSASAQLFAPGSMVETSMPGAGFFNKYPRFRGKPSRILPVATTAKILDYKGQYAKVGLDSGDVGYIQKIMLIEKVSQQRYAPTPSRSSSSKPKKAYRTKKRAPKMSSSPPPPTEDEILAKIKARAAARRKQAPVIHVPTSPMNSNAAPAPQIKGLNSYSKPSRSRVTKPTIPGIPQIPPQQNSLPRRSSSSNFSAPSTTKESSRMSSIPSLPRSSSSSTRSNRTSQSGAYSAPSSKIKINRPVDSSPIVPISSSRARKINQDSALEFRLTTPVAK